MFGAINAKAKDDEPGGTDNGDTQITSLLRLRCILYSKQRQKAKGIAEEPRDALCQLKSCQLLHDCVKTAFEKGLQQVNDLQGHSRS